MKNTCKMLQWRLKDQVVNDKDISNIQFALLIQSESLGVSFVLAAATLFLKDNFAKKALCYECIPYNTWVCVSQVHLNSLKIFHFCNFMNMCSCNLRKPKVLEVQGNEYEVKIALKMLKNISEIVNNYTIHHK